MKKMNFTAKNLADLRKSLNNEFRGFNHCKKFVIEHWAELQAIGEADGLRIEHIEADWMLDRLQGTKFVNGRVFGRTTKAGEFKARTTWTPGAVLDYLRRATRVEWAAIQKQLKEQRIEELKNKDRK